MPSSAQGQGQYQNQKVVSQGASVQEQKKGNTKREDQCHADNQNFNINVSFNTQGQTGHHERHVTPGPHGHPQGHLQGHLQHHHPHVVSTPVHHHGQRQVKGYHVPPHGQHGHGVQGHRIQGQGHQQDQCAIKSQGRRQRKKKVIISS